MRVKKYNKILFFNILTTFYLSIILVSGFAQVFDNTQNPFNVKWKQINSSGFKIIYPTTLEKDAQRMGNTLALIY